MEITHEIIRMERSATKNSGSPMWRCRTGDGQSVNVFQHSDPVKDSSLLFEKAGYLAEMQALQLGEALEWTGAPVRVEMCKKGDWWEVVAVEPRVAGAEADMVWQPDVMVYRRRAQRQAVFIMEDDSICVDIESTGLKADDEVISIAAVFLNGTVIIDTLIRPQNPSKLTRIGKNGLTATDIHGIQAADLVNAESLFDWYRRIDEVLSCSKVIGYNVKFDLQMLDHNFSDHKLDLMEYESVWDVAQLVAEFVGNWNPRRGWFEMITLDEACNMFGIERDLKHDAKADALATLALLKAMAEADVETWGKQPF